MNNSPIVTTIKLSRYQVALYRYCIQWVVFGQRFSIRFISGEQVGQPVCIISSFTEHSGLTSLCEEMYYHLDTDAVPDITGRSKELTLTIVVSHILDIYTTITSSLYDGHDVTIVHIKSTNPPFCFHIVGISYHHWIPHIISSLLSLIDDS